MRFLSAIAVALVAAATASAATSPRDVYRTAMVAAALEKSVHYVSASNLAGNSETIVGDAGLGRGIQRITFTKGGTTGHVTVLVVGQKAFVRGDAFTLTNFLGLTSAQTARYANRWFFVQGPSRTYAVVAEAVEYRSFVRDLLMRDPLTFAPQTSFHGRHATGIRSKTKDATIDLFIGDGLPVPLGQVVHRAQGTVTTTLSHWNEDVSLSAPKGARAFR